jgi:NADH:ubiquinone oxidoreductase subunit E
MDLHTQPCRCGEETDEQRLAHVAEIIELYEAKPTNLIQILHLVQGIYGYLPLDVQQFVAEKMDLPLSEIYGVSTFYSFFSTKPRGEYTIQVCLGTACYVRGSAKILKRLSEMLGIEVGETTKDRKFTLEVMRCMGACGLAPAVMVNGNVIPQVNPDKLNRILEMCD